MEKTIIFDETLNDDEILNLIDNIIYNVYKDLIVSLDENIKQKYSNLN